jgi:hypothetical protein
VLHDVAAHVIAQRLGISAGGCQQSLHSIRCRLPGVLSQLPAVLARHVAERAAPPTLVRPRRSHLLVQTPEVAASRGSLLIPPLKF